MTRMDERCSLDTGMREKYNPAAAGGLAIDGRQDLRVLSLVVSCEKTPICL